jgi:uncharacterized membrane protein
VQGEGDGYSTFVPHVAVTAGLALALFSVGVLIYYVHHIATSLQVSQITAGVARDLEHAIDRLYPEPVGTPVDLPADVPTPPAAAVALHAKHSGYVQEIDSDAVLALAREHEAVIWLTARAGDFAIEGSAVAAAHPPPADTGAFERRLAAAFIVGADRTSQQDAAFAVQQLVEVALRALSPGVNEPFTAITCIDRLGQGLSKLAVKAMPSAARADESGALRVVAHPRTFAELLQEAFDPIARYAGGNPAIYARLLTTLDSLASFATRGQDRTAIAREAAFVLTAAELESKDDRRRAELARLAEAVRTRCAPDAPAAVAPAKRT